MERSLQTVADGQHRLHILLLIHCLSRAANFCLYYCSKILEVLSQWPDVCRWAQLVFRGCRIINDLNHPLCGKQEPFSSHSFEAWIDHVYSAFQIIKLQINQQTDCFSFCLAHYEMLLNSDSLLSCCSLLLIFCFVVRCSLGVFDRIQGQSCTAELWGQWWVALHSFSFACGELNAVLQGLTCCLLCLSPCDVSQGRYGAS